MGVTIAQVSDLFIWSLLYLSPLARPVSVLGLWLLSLIVVNGSKSPPLESNCPFHLIWAMQGHCNKLHP
jgi:hypothetical protein